MGQGTIPDQQMLSACRTRCWLDAVEACDRTLRSAVSPRRAGSLRLSFASPCSKVAQKHKPFQVSCRRCGPPAWCPGPDAVGR